MKFPIDEFDLRCDARRECNRIAVSIVLIHNVHTCDVDGLTPGGDSVWLMCPVDVTGATWRLGVLVGEMFSEIPDENTDETAVPTCETCGLLIGSVDDVLRVESLKTRLDTWKQ